MTIALRAVLTYMGNSVSNHDFAALKKLIAGDTKLLDKLKTYDMKSIPDNVIKRVKLIVLAENFKPAEMFSKSKVAGGLATWCKACYEYNVAWKVVEPKEKRQRELTEKLRIAEEEVAAKKAEL